MKTTYFADSTEFCPIEGLQDLFVCGNYQLIEETRTKVGKLYLLKSDDRYRNTHQIIK